ncbi:oxygen-dependent protoporphyrinogen oxidase [Asanoa hainanensis]|uniref:Coproporphyrinogen III oxidase n=1 Tax=Asanoa hainanensis TaxID=560556 RepID=A0A239LQ37_9ACTN|nr:protoporphyrinogen oxidase [Asanoa hainanensis]SNT32390.1 oxygen-dependent protoporphyrinogen oxidase [Asanoa hainanensis]
MQKRVAVIGGGIAGLAAAVRIHDAAPDTVVTIFEQGATLGGKLRTGELAGSPVELGAEAFLVRDAATGEDSPAVKLAHRLGLGDDLVNPAVGAAALAVNGKLVPMPRGTLTGVPGDLGALAGVAAVDDHDLDAGEPLLAEGEDVAVGALVRRRLGDQVVDRLVDPMLGGVYAGRADRLSLAATMPALARQARREGTLTGAVKAAQAAFPRVPGGAVFATVRGGVSRLVSAAASASGAEIRLGATVRELARTPDGWRLTVGPTRDPEHVVVDAVVLAVPARPAARLLQAVAPGAAEAVGALDYASVALVSLALPRPELPELSGFLVPAENGTAVKAATFFSTKWAHQRRPDGVALVRASVGRYGDEHVLQRDDAELAGIVHRELSTLVDHSLPKPLDTKVQRWGGALPQYAPGHLDRVAAARAALVPTLALAGAGYDGVGIPICVRSGESAADAVLAALRDRPQAG